MKKVMGVSGMVTVDEARAILLNEVRVLGTERVALNDACGRVLREKVFADRDYPPFDKSAMDGFACRRAEAGGALKVAATVPAGSYYGRELGPGECVRIMTGAPLVPGADMVVPVELSLDLGGGRVSFRSLTESPNICFKGEDVRQGELLLDAPFRLRPQDVAVLASVGNACPLVSRRPRIGVVTTGSELVEPEMRLDGNGPDSGRIRNSNAWQFLAQASTTGALAKYYGIVGDDRRKLAEAFLRASAENDVLLISGGVSMGDFDFVPDALRDAGFSLLFEKVRVQPGRPTVFGRKEDCYCFGMPGNPVSGFVIFEVFVRGFLRAMTGLALSDQAVKLILGEDYHRKSAERAAFVPAFADADGVVRLIRYNGSGHAQSLARANVLLEFPAGVARVDKGGIVYARWI